MKPDRVESLSGIGSIDNAKPGTPKRKSRTAEAFMDTMRGKEFVQKFRNAGKDMVTSPKAGYKDGNNGVAVTYRFHEWGIGSFDMPGGKFWHLEYDQISGRQGRQPPRAKPVQLSPNAQRHDHHRAVA